MSRRRFVQIAGELIETDQPAEARASSRPVGDRHYDGLRAPDGADISTRAKHREYMRAHGLTTVDDYRSEFRTAEARRIAARSGADPTRREAIEHAIATLNNRRK